ncbi:hypothetical protein [Nesterenkonia ebinurensis]|uniref:hypothetical protein n=1 Tax=Nesterenkonia ebinurensis TaxID=2608252 RepID=UPI00123DF590|nr:hypothetical protein [Nesterenkonia ebinurensis]
MNEEAKFPHLSHLDERRLKLYNSLRELSPELAGLYSSGIRHLVEIPAPGEERARIAHIGHAMREVVNGMPDVLMGGELRPKRKSSADLIKHLPYLAAKSPGIDLTVDGGQVPVSKPLATQFQEIIEVATAEVGRSRSDAAALLTDDGREETPAIGQWITARDAFVAWCHWERKPTAEMDLPSDDEIEAQIKTVEDVISARTADFFAARQRVDDLLESANDQGKTGAFAEPSEDDVKVALARIPSLQLRRVFYGELRNPNWVRPLFVAGAFTAPPSPEPVEGGIRDPLWPEINYLERVAPMAPSEVVDVLLTLKNSDNHLVRRAVTSAIASVPASEAIRAKPLLMEWKKQGFGWRVDERDLVQIAVNMLTQGEREAGKQFANALFWPSKPSERQDEDLWTWRSKPVLHLKEHWYSEELPKVVAALGEDAFWHVERWLVGYLSASEALTKDWDHSDIGSVSIEDPDDRPDAKQALVTALRDLAVDEFRNEPRTTWDQLMKSGARLLRKIALIALTDALNTEENSAARADMVATATRALDEAAAWGYSSRREFALLLRAVAPLPAGAEAALRKALDAGVRGSREELYEFLITRHGDQDEADKEFAEAMKSWRHRLLAAAGEESLPEDFRQELLRLNEQQGKVEDPLEDETRFSAKAGFNPLKSSVDLSVMSNEQLLDHLENWEPTDSFFDGRWDQGQQLASLLTTNPSMLSGVAARIDRLHPVYLSAILHGWRSALKINSKLNPEDALELARAVLNHEDKSEFSLENDELEDDPDFSGAKSSAIDLLEELLRAHSSEALLNNAMLADVANLLVEHVWDENSWRDYIENSPSSNDDPLHISLNWRWPTAFRGLVRLLLQGVDEPWWKSVSATTLRELAREDTPGASGAVLGESLGRIVYELPEWFDKYLAEDFSSESPLTTQQQVALSASLSHYRFHPEVLNKLRPAFRRLIHHEGKIIDAWNQAQPTLEQLGIWLIEGIIRDELDSDDDLVKEYFSKVDPKVRGQALGRMAFQFKHANSVSDNFRDRLGALWDRRVKHVRRTPEDVQELQDFYWFVNCGRFSPEWWLPRLKEAAELGGLRDSQGVIGDQLLEALPNHAEEVLDAVIALTRSRAEMHDYDLREQTAPTVIARALDSGDDELARRATALMNKLGAEGQINLHRQVESIRQAARRDSQLPEASPGGRSEA